MDPVTGSIIAGGIQSGGNILSMPLQAYFNKKAYEREKADSIAFWKMQNEYNSPAAQMDRFKTAGLNPHLIYGQSNMAGPVKGPSLQPVKANNPFEGVANLPMNIAQLQAQNQQNTNLQQQQKIMEQDLILKAMQAGKLAIETKGKEFDLGLKQELRQTQIAVAMENLRRLQVGNYNTLQRLDIDSKKLQLIGMQTNQSIKESAQRIISMQLQREHEKLKMLRTVAEKDRVLQSISNLQAAKTAIDKDNELRDLDINLRKQGFSSSDPAWQKALIQKLEKLGVTDAIDKGIDWMKEKTWF